MLLIGHPLTDPGSLLGFAFSLKDPCLFKSIHNIPRQTFNSCLCESLSLGAFAERLLYFLTFQSACISARTLSKNASSELDSNGFPSSCLSRVRSGEARALTLDGKIVQGSDFSRYLGLNIQKDGDLDGDVAHRIKAEIGWTRLYQMPPYRVSQEERKMHLMVRPSFPPIYRESEMPDICDISEVIVIIEDDWKVGDLVDWWTDDCYWSGRITGLLEEDKVQVKLQDPPIGEGRCYEVSRKDLRPSLDWSPEHGWTVPTSLDNEHSRCCARVIEPGKQDKITNIGPSKEEAPVVCKAIGPSKVEASVVSKAICPSKEEASVVSKAIGPCKVEASVVSKPIGPCKEEASSVSSATSVSSASSVSSGTSFSSLGSPGTSPSPELSSLPPQEAKEEISGCGPNEEKRGTCTFKGLDLGNAGMGIPSSSDSASSTRVDQSSAATNKHTGNGDWFNHDEPSEKMQVRGQDPLHSSVSNTIESSIMELEELVNKVKWLKRVHKFGFNCANSVTPSWKFLEDRANFTRK